MSKGLLSRKISVWQLLAATYFMVAGGPYGLEDLIPATGYLVGLLLLLVVPFLWSLPTALMVSELSTALPEEGGYYVWVRRALGPFWGFQEAWLSLAASIFDMAIYPKLFVAYLGRAVSQWGGPDLGDGHVALLIGLAVIGICTVVNLRGARVVGGSSELMALAMLLPFGFLVVAALVRAPVAAAGQADLEAFDLFTGINVAMWNYMGWDNASTVAGEVERPQRAYPLALTGALLLIILMYTLTVFAAWRTGIPATAWQTGNGADSTGYWVDVGAAVAGPALATAIAVGGMMAGLGAFNALLLSYSRVPMKLAEDGYLPAVFRRRSVGAGVPYVAIVVCAIAWGVALQLPLKRLFALDIILYGLSLILEFVALAVLRYREPNLSRPFRVPGGNVGALLLGIAPLALIVVAIYHERDQSAGPMNALLLGMIVVVAGFVIYFVGRRLR